MSASTNAISGCGARPISIRPVLTSADIDVKSVHLPLPDWVWSVALARGAQGRRLQFAPPQALSLNNIPRGN